MSAQVSALLRETEAPLVISSACPAAVDMVRKYLPGHAEFISPLPSPVRAHCRLLKEKYGDGAQVVFFEPCAAKKNEADAHPGELALAILFPALEQFLEEKGIAFGPEAELALDPAGEGRFYSVEGGMNDTLRDGNADAARPETPLSVCGPACSGCPDAKVVSTPNCRGCFARPCVYNCPKKAISVVGGQSVIDQSLCVKCGKCVTACPYHAIVKTSVPCEEACPVGAIRKNDSGVAEIDFEKCIFCGKCFSACPFAAVMEWSQLVDVLAAMKRGEKLVAMVAPAAERQFPGKIEQLLTACAKAGFADVMGVALGAEMTTEHERAEFIERMEKDPRPS